MKLVLFASLFLSAPLFAAPAAPRKALVAAAAACFPSCLEDLKSMCTPAGTCTKNAPPTQTDISVGYYCFMNGVKIASSLHNETRTKPDGSICYSVDVDFDGTATKYQYVWKNAAGAPVATESLDYNDQGGRYHSVTCDGTTTMVDMARPECQAEGMQQNPDVDVICTPNASCTLPATGAGGSGGAGGTAGFGGAPTTGAAGGAGGTAGAGGAPAAGGAGGTAVMCGANQTNCGGVCANLHTDNANCGVCGNACKTGFACTEGGCTQVLACPQGQAMCAGTCTDITSSGLNCGTCGHACGAGQVCVSGLCSSSCGANLLMCGQDCKSPAAPTSCGACGTPCATTQICCEHEAAGYFCGPKDGVPAAAYACLDCAPGSVSCDNECIDLSSDPNHCGACGIVCQGKCKAGKCTTDSGHGGCAVGPVDATETAFGLLAMGFVLTTIVLGRRRNR